MHYYLNSQLSVLPIIDSVRSFDLANETITILQDDK